MERSLVWGLLVAIAGCSAAPSDPPVARGPKVLLTPVDQDLGRMHTEDERDVIYALENTGTRDLEIERVDTTCGCVQPKFPKRLAPGEKGEIVVRFVPAIGASGLITEGVKVFTSAQKEPYLLKFQVDLEPPVRISPGTPLVVPIEPGGRAFQVVSFYPRPKSGVTVDGFDSEDPRVRVESLPVQMGASASKLTIRSPGAGDFDVTLNLRTSHKRMREFPFIAQVQAVRGPVSSPAKLMVSALAASAKDAPLPKLLVFARDRPLRVLSAKLDDGAIRVRVGEPTTAGTPVQLSYLGGWRPGRKVMHLDLVIVTDHPTHPTLKVRVEIKVV